MWLPKEEWVPINPLLVCVAINSTLRNVHHSFTQYFIHAYALCRFEFAIYLNVYIDA